MVSTNLVGGEPNTFIDEIAGFYIPDMKAENGFGLPPAIKTAFLALKTAGYEQAINVVTKLQQSNGLQFDAADVNAWGYKLIGQNKIQQALEIFKLNTHLHPNIANTFDSLAETHLALRHKDQAIEFYEKALKLNPEYSNAKHARKMLNSLKAMH